MNQNRLSTDMAASQVSVTELQEILVLHEQKSSQPVVSNDPTVTDIAEAYDIPPEEVAQLLSQVRAGHRPLALSARRRLQKRFAIITLGLVGAMLVLNFDINPNGPSNPVMTLESVTEKPNTTGPFHRTSFVHVDVVMQYHPSSLKRLLFGPQWNHEWNHAGNMPTVIDAKSGEHAFFLMPGGSQTSVGFGCVYRLGLTGFHMGYDIPITVDAKQPATILQKIPMDGTETDITIPLTDAQAPS